jgi:hypothetical protein
VAAQIEHSHVDGVGRAHVLVTPDVAQQLLSTQGALRIAHEVHEQIERGRSQLESPLAAERLARVEVRAHVAVHQGAAARAGRVERLTAQLRAHPRQELVDVERLHQVVIRARVEPRDAIAERVARGEHQDWHGGDAAQATRDLEPVQARQHAVEHDHVGRVGRGQRQGRWPVERNGH